MQPFSLIWFFLKRKLTGVPSSTKRCSFTDQCGWRHRSAASFTVVPQATPRRPPTPRRRQRWVRGSGRGRSANRKGPHWPAVRPVVPAAAHSPTPPPLPRGPLPAGPGPASAPAAPATPPCCGSGCWRGRGCGPTASATATCPGPAPHITAGGRGGVARRRGPLPSEAVRLAKVAVGCLSDGPSFLTFRLSDTFCSGGAEPVSSHRDHQARVRDGCGGAHLFGFPGEAGGRTKIHLASSCFCLFRFSFGNFHFFHNFLRHSLAVLFGNDFD